MVKVKENQIIVHIKHVRFSCLTLNISKFSSLNLVKVLSFLQIPRKIIFSFHIWPIILKYYDTVGLRIV